MGIRLEHAKGLYLAGIRDGKMREALAKHTGDRYTQHSAGVADGKAGFIAFFSDFVARNPVRDIQVVRAFEDGPYVFCHVFQSLNNGAVKWVTADLFDTNSEGRIIEHWDVIEAYAEAPVSGRTMVNGPGEVVDIEHTETNKQLVRDFAANVLVGRQYGTLGDYISAESCDRHRPGVAGGLDGFRTYLGDGVEYVKVHHVVGQGSFVTTYSLVCIAGADHVVVDTFRIDNGRIVEHWDVIEKILPPDQWTNSGKF